MKAIQLTLDKSVNSSFSIRRDIYPKNHNSWHYHEQLELVMVYKGKGSLFLGDAIRDFSEGTCVLIGSNIPHFWLFHDISDSETTTPIDCIAIHFNNDFAGRHLFDMPELSLLKKLISQAEKGLIADVNDTTIISELINASLKNEGASKFIALMEILNQLTALPLESIVSNNYSQLNNLVDEQRMRNVMNFIRDNYRSKIELTTLANEARMTKNSFCRYFKQRTGKTPANFINELRVAHACRLLKNTNMTLKEICFDSGFNNFVSFHKTFKNQLALTPIHFRRNEL